MTRKQFDSYVEKLVEDERRYASFLTHCAFALIAANWALLQTNVKAASYAVIASLIACILYLFVRAMRHRLNLAHLREVLENHSDKVSTLRDKMAVNTPYSRMSQLLNFAELPLIAAGCGLFIASSIAGLITLIT